MHVQRFKCVLRFRRYYISLLLDSFILRLSLHHEAVPGMAGSGGGGLLEESELRISLMLVRLSTVSFGLNWSFARAPFNIPLPFRERATSQPLLEAFWL